MSIKVLIADDQAMVRAGFRMILDTEPDVEILGEAGNGEEAITLARQCHPDVVVMDIRMPRLDGIAATRRLIEQVDPPPRVVIVTTFDDDDSLYEALRAGAAGFLLKNAPPEHLVDAVRTVAGGDGLLSPAVTRRVIEEFARRSPREVASPDVLAQLTHREIEVLRLMARGLSNAEIAELLFITPGTAKTHVGRILEKLKLRDRVQAVVLAYEAGLVRPGSLEALSSQEGGEWAAPLSGDAGGACAVKAVCLTDNKPNTRCLRFKVLEFRCLGDKTPGDLPEIRKRQFRGLRLTRDDFASKQAPVPRSTYRDFGFSTT